jgi:short-subunit dehydrogenase
LKSSEYTSVLITGASGAIGSALARACAAPGMRLTLQGRDEQRLAQLCTECESKGAIVEIKILDIRDTAALIEWINNTAARQGIDLALVNAGAINVLNSGQATEPWVEIENIVNVNICAAMATVSALLPHMQKRRSGQIALISSLIAYFGMSIAPAYSASKAALKTYGEALRPRLAREGIKINVVMPGFVHSDMCDKLAVRKFFVLSADEAAQHVMRGLQKNKPRISFPWPLALGAWLLSVVPQSLAQQIVSWLKYDRS